MAEIDTEKRFNYFGIPLTGLAELKGRYKGYPAIILGSGVTLDDYEDGAFPRWIPRFAVNETIRKVPCSTFWTMSDKLIVRDYHEFPSPETKIIALADSVQWIRKVCNRNKKYTVATFNEVQEEQNDYEFFTAGTTVGTLEIARYMGVSQFFLFGNDYFRTTKRYYFDKHKPPNQLSERQCKPQNRVKDAMLSGGRKIYKTRSLDLWAKRLDVYLARVLIPTFCVGSPHSRCHLAKIPNEEAVQMLCDMREPSDADA